MSSLTQRYLKSQKLPWRAPACCTMGRFPLAAGLAMNAEPASRPCPLWSCICPGKDSLAFPCHISCCDKRHQISLPAWCAVALPVQGDGEAHQVSWVLDVGLAAALWAEHHPPAPQPSPSRCLQTFPSWNQAPHAEESLSSQGKVTSQSPKYSFLVLLHPGTRPVRHQTRTSAWTKSLHIPAAGTAPHICTAGSLTKYLIITF